MWFDQPEFKLSFKGKLKLQLIDMDKQLSLMFMKAIKKGKCDILLDDDTIVVGQLYSTFKAWCSIQGLDSKVSIAKFRTVAEDYMRTSSMKFRLIDV